MKYEGDFVEGSFEGEAKVTFKTGQVIEGLFENN